MNIIPRFIIRRFLPGYLAGFFGFVIYWSLTNLSNGIDFLSILSLLIGIFGFLGMLYWAYLLDQKNP
jgi:hypothetical protein